MNKNILWIDRWKNKFWFAYNVCNTKIILPIWILENNKKLDEYIQNIISKYNIWFIVVGFPKKQKDIQILIDIFIKDLERKTPWIEILRVNEDFTSVSAQVLIGDFKKDVDDIAACKIIENYLNSL